MIDAAVSCSIDLSGSGKQIGRLALPKITNTAGWASTFVHIGQVARGEGPLCVLLHGFPDFSFTWRRQMPELSRRFRAVAVDLRGYNLSDKPDGVESYAMEKLVADVLAVVEHFRAEKAIIAGHDWGGAVAWSFAMRHPERTDRLVIFNLPHPAVFAEAQRDGTARTPGYWFFFQLPWLPELALRSAHWRALVENLRTSARPGTFPDDELPHYRYAWDRDGAMGTMLDWYRAAVRVPRARPCLRWTPPTPRASPPPRTRSGSTSGRCSATATARTSRSRRPASRPRWR